MLKLTRLILSLAVLTGLVSVAYVSQSTEPAAAKMATAAEKFLASLTAEQKAKATFDFDDKERLNWHFVPLQDKNRQPTRKGVRLEEMTPEQKELALGLLRAGTSPSGYTTATTIMSLEAILHELEKGGTNVRNPEWYFFTIFGTPSKTGKWGWRVEGHHLSLNFALDGGRVVAATPAVFAANPATVKQGPRKGTRTLAEAEDLAIQLFKSLNEDQRKVAHQKTQFREIEGQKPKPTLGPPVGVTAAQLSEEQRAILMKLIRSYAERMPEDIASMEMKKVNEAQPEEVYFAFAGGTESGQPHTYRIQGPKFVIEFLNVQADSARNPANHIHSGWRNPAGDFGLAPTP